MYNNRIRSQWNGYYFKNSKLSLKVNKQVFTCDNMIE